LGSALLCVPRSLLAECTKPPVAGSPSLDSARSGEVLPGSASSDPSFPRGIGVLLRGYNTDAERAEAEASGIRVLSLESFVEFLTWGVIMGVDDGCEPEPDEITR